MSSCINPRRIGSRHALGASRLPRSPLVLNRRFVRPAAAAKEDGGTEAGIVVERVSETGASRKAFSKVKASSRSAQPLQGSTTVSMGQDSSPPTSRIAAITRHRHRLPRPPRHHNVFVSCLHSSYSCCSQQPRPQHPSCVPIPLPPNLPRQIADTVPTLMRLRAMLPHPAAPKPTTLRRHCAGLHAAVGPAARRPDPGGPCIPLRCPVPHLYPAALHHPGVFVCVSGEAGASPECVSGGGEGGE